MDPHGDERGFFDGPVRWKPVGVPAEEDIVGHSLNIHVGAADHSAVVCGILDHFFVKPSVFLPAGDGIKHGKIKGKTGHIQIGQQAFGSKGILLKLPKLLTDKKLK